MTGLLVQDLSGELHTAEIENLAFSPDGRSLASVSRDGTLKLWQVPGPAQRIGAYARYNYEKWARKNEFEKTAEFDARTSHKVERVREFQDEGRDLMLKNYAATADWSSLTLKDYNADTEQFAVASARFPAISYHVKVSPREAEQFRNNFARVSYAAPVFVYADNTILLDNVGATVAVASGAPRQYVITR